MITSSSFHTNNTFQANGRFFVHYSSFEGGPVLCTAPGEWCGTGFSPACVNNQCVADHYSVIAEYRVSQSDPNVADPVEVRRILTIAQPARIHNLGAMLFGPDTYLYIALGDGTTYYSLFY